MGDGGIGIGDTQMRQALGRKVIHGIGWTFGSSVLTRLIQFLTMIALARLLLPSEFGLFAMVSMVIVAIMVLRDRGLGEALLYYKADLKDNADTTFTLSVIFGVVVWFILWMIAPIAAIVFNDQAVIWPLRVLGSAIPLSSISLVPVALLERELEFSKRAVPEIAMGISYSILAIALALAGGGVWSLILACIVSTVVSTALAWRISGWMPSFSFKRKCADRMISFGKPLMLSSAMLLLFMYVDQAAVGRWLGTSSLGCYSVAFTICHLPATNIAFTVNKVMYPAYTKMGDDIASVRKAYLQTVRMISILSLPIAFWLCFMSEDLVSGFLGDKWTSAVPLMQVLAYYGLLRSIGCTADSLFMASGKTPLVSRTSSLQILTALPLTYPVVINYGAVGVAVLFTGAYLIGSCYAIWNITKLLGIPIIEFINLFRFPLLASAAVVSASFGLSTLLPPGIYALIGSAIAAILIYVPVVLILDRRTVSTIRWVLENR